MALILGTFPVAALVIVTSLIAEATVPENLINSLPFASAIKPEEANLGAVRVLLVNVSVVSLPTNVSVLVGSVNVPVLEILQIIGVVSVLLVNVCVWSLNTNSSFPVNNGNVTVLSAVNSLDANTY